MFLALGIFPWNWGKNILSAIGNMTQYRSSKSTQKNLTIVLIEITQLNWLLLEIQGFTTAPYCTTAPEKKQINQTDEYDQGMPQSQITDQPIGPVKQKNKRKIVIIIISISWNMCFGCSKELSHWDGSFGYPQHMFWLRNKKIILRYVLLSGGLPIQGTKRKGH